MVYDKNNVQFHAPGHTRYNLQCPRCPAPGHHPHRSCSFFAHATDSDIKLCWFKAVDPNPFIYSSALAAGWQATSRTEHRYTLRTYIYAVFMYRLKWATRHCCRCYGANGDDKRINEWLGNSTQTLSEIRLINKKGFRHARRTFAMIILYW